MVFNLNSLFLKAMYLLTDIKDMLLLMVQMVLMVLEAIQMSQMEAILVVRAAMEVLVMTMIGKAISIEKTKEGEMILSNKLLIWWLDKLLEMLIMTKSEKNNKMIKKN